MSSERNTDRLVEAAREVILTVGWRRATLTDVARRAGVSRMTVYRAFPDMQSLLAELMTREWVAEVDRVVREAGDGAHGRADHPAGAGTAGTIADGFAAAVRALRANELFRRILDVDPEQLLPYLIDRRGRSQDALVDALAGRIAAAQTAGGVRAGDSVVLARSLVLAAHGFALSAPTMVDGAVTTADLDRELATLVRTFLEP